MRLSKILVLFSVILFVSACTPPIYKEYSHNVDQSNAQLNDAFKKPVKLNSHLGTLVLDSNTAAEQQTWLKTKVSIHTKEMPFSQVANHILSAASASNAFESGVDQTTPVTINFDGTRLDALKLLSTQTNYGYTISGKIVTWSTLMTKTFDVSFMPGAAKYQVGETSSGGASTGGSSGGGNATTTTDLNSYGEYSSITGDLSLWKDLEATIKNMLSDKGKVDVSQATTTITVTDHPENVQMVQDYLATMNQSLSRQVALDVQVLEISLNKGFMYGIDWNMARKFMSGRYTLNFANQGSAKLNTTLAPSGISILELNATSGPWDGTQNVINALEQQGKVSIDTQPRVVTLNNQVAEIGINTQTTYLASVSTTTTVNVGNTATLTPGVVTTGFTLYLLPKIQSNNVYMQITSTLSNLVTIQTLQGSTTGSNSADSANTIGGPIVQSKRFNERAVVPSGDTLILAGFKQLKNEATKQSLFGSDSLGGYGGNQNNIETVVLITPTILDMKR